MGEGARGMMTRGVNISRPQAPLTSSGRKNGVGIPRITSTFLLHAHNWLYISTTYTRSYRRGEKAGIFRPTVGRSSPAEGTKLPFLLKRNGAAQISHIPNATRAGNIWVITPLIMGMEEVEHPFNWRAFRDSAAHKNSKSGWDNKQSTYKL